MITIKVDITKADNFLNRVHSRISVGTEDVIRNLTSVGHNLAQTLAPVDTGALRENITSNVKTDGSITTGMIISEAIEGVGYNIYQEFGTGQSGAANVIHSRAKSGLKNPVDGITYNPNITGFGAQPFMYPTYVYLQKNAGKELQKMVKGAIK